MIEIISRQAVILLGFALGLSYGLLFAYWAGGGYMGAVAGGLMVWVYLEWKEIRYWRARG